MAYFSLSSRSKIYEAVLEDLVESSKEIRRLKEAAKKNEACRFKLIRIIGDVLKARSRESSYSWLKIIKN